MENKTLIVGPSWVGDMVMAQALFKAIKARLPEAQIDVLAPQWSRPLIERMPQVNEGLAMPLGHGELGLGTRIALGRKLKNTYQRCFVLPNSFKSALIPFFAGIPHRIGWRGEWRYGLLNDCRTLNKARLPLMVQRYVALAYDKGQAIPNKLPRPRLVVNTQNVESALESMSLSHDLPILVLCPGAEFGPSKRWPESYYANIAQHYLSLGWQVWIMGSKKDGVVARHICNEAKGCVDLTGRTTLGDAIDLMSLASAIVSNDSGLMHIAAALDRPLVAIYGSTDPSYTPPLNDKVEIVRARLPCSPCFERTCPLEHHECMKSLKPSSVLHALDRRINACVS